VVKKSLEPEWAPEQNTFEFDLSKGELTDLKITLKDSNWSTPDVLLGTACITVDKLKALMAGKPAPKLDEFYISSPDGAALIGQSQQRTFVVLKLNAKEALPPEFSLAECMLGIQAVVVVMCFWLLLFGVLMEAFTLLLFGVLTVAFMAWNWYVRSGEAKRGCQCLLVPKPGEAAHMSRLFQFLFLVLTVFILLKVLNLGEPVGCFSGGPVISKLALKTPRSPMSNSAHASRELETCSATLYNVEQDLKRKVDAEIAQKKAEEEEGARKMAKREEAARKMAKEENQGGNDHEEQGPQEGGATRRQADEERDSRKRVERRRELKARAILEVRAILEKEEREAAQKRREHDAQEEAARQKQEEEEAAAARHREEEARVAEAKRSEEEARAAAEARALEVKMRVEARAAEAMRSEEEARAAEELAR
jgi:hypothetical protein